MINNASDILNKMIENNEKLPYDYIFVDEYQDISHDEFENRNDIEVVAGRIMFIRKMK